MKPYYDDGQVTIYHADVRNLTAEDLGHAACVVTSPPYNVGVAYDCWDDCLTRPQLPPPRRSSIAAHRRRPRPSGRTGVGQRRGSPHAHLARRPPGSWTT